MRGRRSAAHFVSRSYLLIALVYCLLHGHQRGGIVLENFRIRVFRAVARHLNFSRAAEELFLTQPAVTQQIKALEDELRLPLFDRTGGHISLTPAGKALLPLAEKMKALSDDALVAVAGAYGQHAGELSLGASQTIGQYLL